MSGGAVLDHPRYVARPDSLTARVLRYLQANPGSELSRHEIFRTFGVMNLSGIDGMLSHAVSKGALERAKNRDDLLVWRLGPNRNVVLQAGQDAPEAFVPLTGPRAHDPFGQRAFVRLMHIPILRNTPIDPARRQVSEVPRWLACFDVGDSAELPPALMDGIHDQIKRYEEEHKVRFEIMSTGPDRVGIERVA